MCRKLLVIPAVLMTALFIDTRQTAAATTCENLTMLSLANTTITLAQTVASGAFTPPPAPARAAAPGAPAIYASKQSAGQIWIWNATHKDDASFLTPATYAVLHDAVVAQCDMLDGVKDGVLEDPTRCKFDPKVVQCKEADAPNCLTAPQVEAARKIYRARKTAKAS